MHTPSNKSLLHLALLIHASTNALNGTGSTWKGCARKSFWCGTGLKTSSRIEQGGKEPRIRGLKHFEATWYTCSMLLFGCSTNFCQSQYCSCLTYPQATGRLSMRRAHVCVCPRSHQEPPNCSGAQKVPSVTISNAISSSLLMGDFWKSGICKGLASPPVETFSK